MRRGFATGVCDGGLRRTFEVVEDDVAGVGASVPSRATSGGGTARHVPGWHPPIVPPAAAHYQLPVPSSGVTRSGQVTETHEGFMVGSHGRGYNRASGRVSGEDYGGFSGRVYDRIDGRSGWI